MPYIATAGDGEEWKAFSSRMRIRTFLYISVAGAELTKGVGQTQGCFTGEQHF